MRTAWIVLACCLLASPVMPQSADTPGAGPDAPLMQPDELLALAAVLISDGHHLRAREILSRIDTARESLDRIRYHTLSGLVALNLNEPALAAREFESAIEAGQSDPLVWLYLAQARFRLEDYPAVLDALDRAGDEATGVPAAFAMRAHAAEALGRPDEAWDALESARALFTEHAAEFARRQVLLLVNLGLFQQASEFGLALLAENPSSIDDAVIIANALREAGRGGDAARVLEQALLAAPEDVRVLKLLAHVYLQQDQPLAAANLLHRAAVFDADAGADAAELYRRAGWLMNALLLNGQIRDERTKLKQRLAIYLQMGRFEQAAGMANDLGRSRLIEDEEIRYALAYALFKSGRFGEAERYLQTLTRADLFRRAAELRRTMAACADNPWACA